MVLVSVQSNMEIIEKHIIAIHDAEIPLLLVYLKETETGPTDL